MRVWVNRHSTEILFDCGDSCNTRKAATPDVHENVHTGTETANFVERWVKNNKAVEALFDGKPWPVHPKRYVTMVDFGKQVEFAMGSMQADKIPTFLAHQRGGYLLIVQFYVSKNRSGHYRCHVRIREERCGIPAYLILDH